uniref:Uncharacterized protein n=1 Tax=Chromera velia CCMP2878 TaxID=1169474 RepID=A0A0G4GWD7_9ALVE|eukprot:Cvel_5310.t1-p1 / transcript=Cvel_5310.t1 / gene=Cvel_5310 / organism=Chromera_velia_CCMP2878 / gene_product=hypothetical protein / transcript_product=hypothetical protein / location=Cvel_scaffold246:29400-31288(+) / protein_length=108 / sequence_SO=supercontig / SO=protein_coding / is_pseudo=false
MLLFRIARKEPVRGQCVRVAETMTGQTDFGSAGCSALFYKVEELLGGAPSGHYWKAGASLGRYRIRAKAQLLQQQSGFTNPFPMRTRFEDGWLPYSRGKKTSLMRALG